MTAGAPHGTTNTAGTRQAGRILAYFQAGHSLDYVCEQGVLAANRWTRARVQQVVDQLGLHLVNGRIPGLDPADPLGARQPEGIPAPRPSVEDPDRPAALGNLRRVQNLPVDALLAEADRHPSGQVRAAAARYRQAAMRARDVLDDLRVLIPAADADIARHPVGQQRRAADRQVTR